MRLVDPSDTDAVAALAGLRWAWAGERGPRETLYADFAPAFAAWFGRAAGSHTAVLARRGTAPLGMGWLAAVERVPDVDRPVRRSGLVQTVYVGPAHRCAGVGQVIIQVVLDQARRLELEYVEVHPSARSFPFYRRLGFEGRGATLRLRLTGAAARADGGPP